MGASAHGSRRALLSRTATLRRVSGANHVRLHTPVPLGNPERPQRRGQRSFPRLESLLSWPHRPRAEHRCRSHCARARTEGEGWFCPKRRAVVARTAPRARARRARPRPPRSRPTGLTEPARRALILERLAAAYPNAVTALHYQNPFQLLVAVILSAQCTDARVNLVTPELFARYSTPQALASAKRRDLERIIKSCGFFRMKTRNLIGASSMLVERYRGQVPSTIDELLELPGVGRKTANVILAVVFGQAAIAVDTHVFRVANRLRLARATTSAKMELALQRVIPQAQWSHAHHWLIYHGRQVCHARKPACPQCVLLDLCPSAKYFL
ncbi:MAG: endonuclease III [Candidatus Eremiobacteraeota bacterium]|nr:endonuclease III [Candidatus Eremiobacteraeota bacterium]